MTRTKRKTNRTRKASNTRRSKPRAVAAAPNRHRNYRPRAHNRRRSNGRRRNPAVRPIVTGAVFAAAGNIATNIAAGFVPIQASGWMGIAIKLGLAYVVGMVAERLGVSPMNANYMAIGGFAGAAGEAIHMVIGTVTGGVQSLTAAPPAPAPTTVGYLNDIAPFPDDLNRYSLGGLDDVAPVGSYYSN
jgi:hypothetical protein